MVGITGEATKVGGGKPGTVVTTFGFLVTPENAIRGLKERYRLVREPSCVRGLPLQRGQKVSRTVKS